MINIMIYIKTKIYIWIDVLFCIFLFNNHINTSNFIKKNYETEFSKKNNTLKRGASDHFYSEKHFSLIKWNI